MTGASRTSFPAAQAEGTFPRAVTSHGAQVHEVPLQSSLVLPSLVLEWLDRLVWVCLWRLGKWFDPAIASQSSTSQAWDTVWGHQRRLPACFLASHSSSRSINHK